MWPGQQCPGLTLEPIAVRTHLNCMPIYAYKAIEPATACDYCETEFELLRSLFMDLVEENPDIWTEAFQADLVETMREGIRLEKEFIKDCLPINSVGLSSEEFCAYIDYIANRRLQGVGLPELSPGLQNPLPWLAELMDIQKEQNFFEGRVTEYQKSSALATVDDDEL